MEARRPGASRVLEEDRSAAPGTGAAVLVVEDEVLVQMLVLEVVDDLGLKAFDAADGPSALRILEAEPSIGLIVTDVGLPGMSGRQLASAARDLRPDVKVLFVTGYADRAQAGEFAGEGMDMIVKPFNLDALAGKITGMIG